MDKAGILELARKHGLAEHLDLVERALKPAIGLILTSDEDVPLGASRFGGHPDLPRGVEWPTHDDVPMEFVGQIRLADVAAHDAEGVLPKDGHLFFFRSTQWEWSDMLPGDQRYSPARVLHHAGGDGELARRAAPRVEYSDEYRKDVVVPTVYRSARVASKQRLLLPWGAGAFAEELGLSDLEVWPDFMAAIWGSLADGPAPTEEDPYPSFPANHMLGYLGGDDYVDAMTPDDVVLLEIDSDEAAGFHWGDMDKLYFILSAADLAARDFSRVRIHNQLG